LSLGIAIVIVLAYFFMKDSSTYLNSYNSKEATTSEIFLSEELGIRDIDVTLRYYDGFKTVDLTIHNARVHLVLWKLPTAN